MTVHASVAYIQVATRLRDIFRLSLHRLDTLLLLLNLEQQRAIDVGKNTSKSDGGADERVEFLVASDSKLKMARGDTLDLQVLSGVACQLEDFGSQVFEDRSQVNACFGADAGLLARDGSKVALYATTGELQRRDVSASSHMLNAKGECAGWLGDDARYRATTYLEAGFGGVRLGCLYVRVAFTSCLASSLS